jgi:GNAT superfamily N-acetyltransferase
LFPGEGKTFKINSMERVLAKPSDLERLYSLFLMVRERMEQEGNSTWSGGYPSKEDFQADIQEGHSYLYFEEGVLIAYIHASFDPLEDFFWRSRSLEKLAQLRKDTGMKDDEGFLLLHRLMISPAYQGRGLAEKIFLDQAKLYPHTMMMFAVYPANKKALKAYDRYGFSNAGIYSAFEYGDVACYLYYKRYQ